MVRSDYPGELAAPLINPFQKLCKMQWLLCLKSGLCNEHDLCLEAETLLISDLTQWDPCFTLNMVALEEHGEIALNIL